MMKAQTVADKLAIGLSLVCTFHCLVLPVLLVVLPSLTALQLQNETFHLWMVVVVLPTSVYALTLGCRQHKRFQMLAIGCVGLALLVIALLFGEKVIGESGEKMLTVIGASLVAIVHGFNYHLCRAQQHKNCDFPQHDRRNAA